MIEAIITPSKAKKSPLDVAILAFVFVTIAVATQLLLPEISGSIIVFAIIPSIPLLWSLLEREEEEEEKAIKALAEKSIAYHMPLIEAFTYYFIGAVAAYAFWFVLIPSGARAAIYASQINELKAISSLAMSAHIFKPAIFELLITHNLQVMFLMFVFCLVYGIGSVYMLLWNASLMGVFIGSKIVENGIVGGLIGIFGILPHAMFEIGGYFVATIAGGIFSMALVRKHYQRGEFKYILRDIALLALTAIILIIIGALVESSY